LLSVRPFRGVSRQVVVLAACRCRDPIFREVRVQFRGFVRLSNRAFVGPALPVRRLPFPAASLGFSCRSVLPMAFTPPAVLSSGSLPPRSQSPVNRTRSAIRVHLSWGSVPLRRSTETGARMTRRVPTAGTVRPQRFARSRRLTSPVTMVGLFHPTYALGVEPGPQLLAWTFRPKQGRCARVPSSRLSLSPRRARFGVLSSLALRRGPRLRGTR